MQAVSNACPNTNIELYWADEDIPSSGWIKYRDQQKTFEYYSHSETELALNFLQEHFPYKYDLYQEYVNEENSDSDANEASETEQSTSTSLDPNTNSDTESTASG